jgi:hypothetical protein
VCNREVVLNFQGDPAVCITTPADAAACIAATTLTAKEPRSDKGGAAGGGVPGGLAGPPAPPWALGEETHAVVQRMAGAGPWSWQGVTPISFLRGGKLVVRRTPTQRVWQAATSKADPRQQQDWFLKCLHPRPRPNPGRDPRAENHSVRTPYTQMDS